MAAVSGTALDNAWFFDGADVGLPGAQATQAEPVPEAAEFYDAQEQRDRSAAMKLTAEGIQTLAQRCHDLPAASKEACEVAELVRDATKNMLSCVDDKSKGCHNGLLDMIDARERRHFELVLAIGKGGHQCGNLVQAVTDLYQRIDKIFDIAGSGNAGSNVSFNSKFVQQELQRLDGVLADLVETEQTLSKISSAEHRESLMIAIQAVSKQLCTSDILANLAETLEMHSRLAEEQNKVHLKRGEKQALVWVAEAEMNSHKTRLEHAKEHRQRTKSSLDAKKKELEQLQTRENISREDLLRSHKERKLQLEKQLEDLRARAEKEQAKSKAPIDLCQDKTLELQKQLLNLDSLNINHIILVVDKSGSMDGRRWRSLLRAVDAFQKACVAKGSQDKVSVVTFDVQATAIVKAAPITTDIVGTLRKVTPGWQTAYAPAWKAVQERVAGEPTFARIFVVFLSDGLTGKDDMNAAAAMASRVHADAAAANRSMCAFFVHVEDTPSPQIEGHLMPLVKAANGGQSSKACGESVVDLLRPVNTEDLTSHFDRLASYVNMEKCVLESRLAMVKSQEREMRAKSMEETKAVTRLYRDQVQSITRASMIAEKGMRNDQGKLQELFAGMVAEMQEEVGILEAALDNAEGTVLALETLCKQSEAAFFAAKSDFDQGEDAFKQTCGNLSKMCLNQAKQLEKIGDQQGHFLEQFGTTDARLLMQQLQTLNRLTKQLQHSSVIEQDLCCMVHSMVTFTNSLKDQIMDPLPGGTSKISKAKVVLKKLLKQRHLEYKDLPEEDMQTLLKYEATVQRLDPEDVCKPILSAGITAERICEAVDEMDNEKVTELKKDLVSVVQQKAFELEECDTQEIDETKRSKKKELKNKKAELTKKETELKQARKTPSKSNLSTSDEDNDSTWEVVEEAREQVDDLKDEIKELEDDIKDLEGQANGLKKAQQATAKKLEPCTRTLQLAVEICCTTFREQVAEEEKSALRSTFESFRTNIYKPMSDFVSMAQQAKSMFTDSSSIQPPTLLGARGSGKQMALQDSE